MIEWRCFDLEAQLYGGALAPKRGRILVPQSPGLGIEQRDSRLLASLDVRLAFTRLCATDLHAVEKMARKTCACSRVLISTFTRVPDGKPPFSQLSHQGSCAPRT
jgi:hypothetical protein